MSIRHMLLLTNNRTKEEEWFQLFGNHEYYETFEKYIRTLDVTFEYEEEFLFDDVIIPDLNGLIKAIDESIWNEIIKDNIKPHDMRPYAYYSTSLDFSNNLLNQNSEPYCSLFAAAYQTLNYSYLAMSYSVYLWLKSHGAITDEHIREIEHDYFDRSDYVIMGKLDPNFTLSISRS